MSPRRRFTILLCISMFAFASCGGDDAGTEATTTSTVPGDVATTAASTTSTESSNETTTTTADAATGNGNIELVFDDGRSWTFVGSCVYTPNNSGPASALWNIEGEAADGASFGAIMVFPFDPANNTPVLIGTMVDADENVFVVVESEDVSDGSNLILNLGLYDNVFRAVGDPIDITATVTCRY